MNNSRKGKKRPIWIAISGLRTKFIVSLTLVDDPCKCIWALLSEYHVIILGSCRVSIGYYSMYVLMPVKTRDSSWDNNESDERLTKNILKRISYTNERTNKRKKCLLCVECVFFLLFVTPFWQFIQCGQKSY